MKHFFVTGIGTDVGKTVVSAILMEALKADYWKPLQAGDLKNTDSMKILQLVNSSAIRFHQEAYRLRQPMSPHAAANIDGVHISIQHILEIYHTLVATKSERLIIEGAGGVMVPLNHKELMIDLIQQLQIPAILVASSYLGSINHTLLSISALKSLKIPIAGIVFNEESNPESERYILQHSKLPCIGNIPRGERVDKTFVKEMAQRMQIPATFA